MTQTEAAEELQKNIRLRREQAQADRRLDRALLMAQLDGATYVLDCLGAPSSEGPYSLSIQDRIDALRLRAGLTDHPPPPLPVAD